MEIVELSWLSQMLRMRKKAFTTAKLSTLKETLMNCFTQLFLNSTRFRNLSLRSIESPLLKYLGIVVTLKEEADNQFKCSSERNQKIRELNLFTKPPAKFAIIKAVSHIRR